MPRSSATRRSGSGSSGRAREGVDVCLFLFAVSSLSPSLALSDSLHRSLLSLSLPRRRRPSEPVSCSGETRGASADEAESARPPAPLPRTTRAVTTSDPRLPRSPPPPAMLQTRLAQAPRPSALLRQPVPRTLRPRQLHAPPSRPPPRSSIAPRPRPGQGGQGDSHSHHSHSRLHYALVPLVLGAGGLSSTLLCDSPSPEPKHSLKSILANVEKPNTDEFLVAVNARDVEDDDDLPGGRRWVRRVRRFLRDYLVEPLATSARFVQLALIFLPVILSAPILALELVDETRDRRRGRQVRTRERTTTRWWYRLLVHQMEMAGPTFIKVRPLSSSPAAFRARADSVPSSLAARAVGRLAHRPVPRRAVHPLRPAALAGRRPLVPLHQARHRARVRAPVRPDLRRVPRGAARDWRHRPGVPRRPQPGPPPRGLPHAQARRGPGPDGAPHAHDRAPHRRQAAAARARRDRRHQGAAPGRREEDPARPQDHDVLRQGAQCAPRHGVAQLPRGGAGVRRDDDEPGRPSHRGQQPRYVLLSLLALSLVVGVARSLTLVRCAQSRSRSSSCTARPSRSRARSSSTRRPGSSSRSSRTPSRSRRSSRTAAARSTTASPISGSTPSLCVVELSLSSLSPRRRS